ncbi:MAG: hypothetical protein II932_09215, partial [Treponema sp.]|nr:hypothetical protein [Treponema sp.]
MSTVAACGRKVRATFSFLLCCILLPGVLGLAACNGNGGSKDSGGAVYSPGGGATGGTEDGKPSVSAEDLLNLSNRGWADEICALFPFGDDEPHQTFHISFSASELGVPEDGYVKLVITGGDEVWVGTVSVSADGIAYFTDIPMVRVGAKVSATMYGYAADGTLVSSGYDEGTTTEDGVLLHIGIIGPPSIILSGCTANGNWAPYNGTNYEVMEYPGSSPVMTVINANAASTMEVTINGVAASATTPLNDGFNKIVATVSRGNNPPVSATKYVYVVKQLVDPVLITAGSSYGRTVADGGVSYDVVEYPLTALGLTVVNMYAGDNDATGAPSVLSVTVNGSTVPSATQLADGPNTVVATLTKEYCTPLTLEKHYYAVKALTEPTVSFPNGTHYSAEDSGDYEMWKYSYLAATDWENLLMTVTNTYTGDNAATGEHSTMQVVVGGGGSYSGETVISRMTIPDGSLIVSITVSKDHCEDVVLPVKLTARIKPVTFTVNGLELSTTWDDGIAGDSCEFYGYLNINEVDCGRQPSSGEVDVAEGNGGSSFGGWSGRFGYSGTNNAFRITDKSGSETFKFTGWKETDTGSDNNVTDKVETKTIVPLINGNRTI